MDIATKTVLGISDLRQKIDAHREFCEDWFAETREMAFAAPMNLRFQASQAGGLFKDGIIGSEAHLNDHAFGQLQTRLDGPGVRWLADDQRCPPDLRATVMNALLSHRENARLMLRQNGPNLRAVLSDQYTPFDHHQLVGLIEQAVDMMPPEFGGSAQVHRAEVGDVLRAWVLFPSITFAPDPKGENGGLHPAIWMGNSEIGTGSVRVHGGVFRSVCSNGMIYGWQTGEAFKVAHRFLSAPTMQMTIADALAAALKMSETAAQAFISAQQVRLVPSRVNDLIGEWAGKYGLEVDSKEAWSAMVKGEALTFGRADDPRLFDVLNGLTFAAQDRGTDERELMERMAGDLLAAPLPERYLHR